MAAITTSVLSRKVSSSLFFIPSRNHRGYLPFQGRIPSLESHESKLRLQFKAINLKPVKRIHFKVDPLHPQSHSIRQLMSMISHEKVTRTGPKTTYKYEFLSDRSEPEVQFTFLDDQDLKLLIKTANLGLIDILYEMNKIVLPLVKEDVLTTSTVGKPKPAGKASGGKGKKK